MKNIAAIQTGGTITSDLTEKGKEPKLSLEDVMQKYFTDSQKKFMMRNLKISKTFKPFGKFGLDSSLLRTQHVQEIAEIVKNNYNSFDGFLITHGTDTLSYSASLLSFMIQGGNKPIVITSSQKAPYEEMSDAPQNLFDALNAVGYGKPGVYVVFAGKVIQGSRIGKVSSSELEAFSPINSQKLKLKEFLEKGFSNSGESFGKPVAFNTKINSDVDILRVTLTTMPEDIDYYFSQRKLDGLVAQPFGLGGATPEVYERMNHWIKKGKIIVLRSQCANGITDPSEYTVGYPAIKGGAISAVDMSVEAAYSKLMWVLSRKENQSREEIKKAMHYNFVGEINPEETSAYLQREKNRINQVR